jgi:uncharacterized protein (TIGR02452 family)
MKDPRELNRPRAAALGQEAVLISRAGNYTAPSGHIVDLRPDVEPAVAGTVAYPPNTRVPNPAAGTFDTSFAVTNGTTLSAGRCLAEACHRVCALNFASAKNPGGGFLGGSRAQEESLARSPALYVCIEGNPMYDYHRRTGDPMYSHYALYSPDVPVFRDDAGDLLERPWPCSFITCPAVNAKVTLGRDPDAGPAMRDAIRERVGRVLAIAAAHGHSHLVLGAWGCGVFGNDPVEIAGLFRESLDGTFQGVFEHVTFAVLDSSVERRVFGAFDDVFGGGAHAAR